MSEAGGLLNGTAHLLISIMLGRYFPGTLTAPLSLAVGIALLRRLTPRADPI